VLPLYALTLFLSAFLLFFVQPMFAKMVLPRFGGAPAVWNTAMVFLQGTLLLGYFYAHLSTRLLGLRWQTLLHGGVLLVNLLPLPIAAAAGWTSPPPGAEVVWLIGLLAVSVGLPFFAISATAPPLQRWFAHTDHPAAGDPYFLYGASNVGSLLALLAYPVILEPNIGATAQSRLWAFGYLVLAALIGAPAGAQVGVPRDGGRPQIWNVGFGTHVSELPTNDWVDPACGTNGGPRGQLIERFENFARCPRDSDTGLYEIWLSYDDEAELIARAHHDEALINRFRANLLFNVPAVLSLLVDEGGLVQGYRIASDTRAPPAIRMHAHNVARTLMGLARLDEANCINAPPEEGERPFEGVLLKQFCRQLVNGRRVTIVARAYLKPGQFLVDPVTQQPHPNAFESFFSLEIVNAADLRASR
jgi:hypothetical protein